MAAVKFFEALDCTPEQVAGLAELAVTSDTEVDEGVVEIVEARDDIVLAAKRVDATVRTTKSMMKETSEDDNKLAMARDIRSLRETVSVMGTRINELNLTVQNATAALVASGGNPRRSNRLEAGRGRGGRSRGDRQSPVPIRSRVPSELSSPPPGA